ncbi:hypothetical protein [Amycolatopsis camponoti]|uniref:hypothetical protein n=1 Tax=Amycolatopsis camponoti TaxID=2606593 RepID=UPI0018C1DCA3|nr:hypothetical protein [Amycolatopsis camponoti]
MTITSWARSTSRHAGGAAVGRVEHVRPDQPVDEQAESGGGEDGAEAADGDPDNPKVAPDPDEWMASGNGM